MPAMIRALQACSCFFTWRTDLGTEYIHCRLARESEQEVQEMASRTSLKSSTILSAVFVAGSIGLYAAAYAAEPADKEKTTASEQAQQVAQKPDTPEIKQEVKVKKELGATAKTETNSHSVPVQDVSAKKDEMNKQTAKAVNKVPGVNLKQADLQPPAEDPPIKGFHPIKRLLQPVVRLEKNSVMLEQQIMKLEGPIGSLQPAMLGLDHKMDGVDKRMGTMHGQLNTMSGELTTMSTDIKDVSGKMNGVRQDIGGMRTQIKGLEVPIRQLQKPLNDLQEPLSNVAKPLQEVQKELSDMRTLLATVLGAIVIATICIAVGTPVAAVLIFKNRHTLFPNMHDQDFPGAKAAEKRKEPAHV